MRFLETDPGRIPLACGRSVGKFVEWNYSLSSTRQTSSLAHDTRLSASRQRREAHHRVTRIVLDIAGIRGRRGFGMQIRSGPVYMSTPPLLSLLNPRRNSHSSRSHPLHAQGALFSIFLYPIVLCLDVYPAWIRIYTSIYTCTYIKFDAERK